MSSKPKVSIGYGGTFYFGLIKAHNRNAVKSYLYKRAHQKEQGFFVASSSKEYCFCEKKKIREGQ